MRASSSAAVSHRCRLSGRPGLSTPSAVASPSAATSQVVVAAIGFRPASDHDLAQLERHWKTAVGAAHLTFTDGRAALTLDVEAPGWTTRDTSLLYRRSTSC